jgi:hypothetical protein
MKILSRSCRARWADRAAFWIGVLHIPCGVQARQSQSSDIESNRLQRVERARDLLLHLRLTLAQIAALCGFADRPGECHRQRRGRNLGNAAVLRMVRKCCLCHADAGFPGPLLLFLPRAGNCGRTSRDTAPGLTRGRGGRTYLC